MSASERRALLLLLSLGVLGQAVRWWRGRPDEAPGAIQLLADLPPRSPGPHRDSILALARPLGPDERIDPNLATAEQLARLPRVGLALAKRIVADREANGAFAEANALDRVPGIGPGLLATIGPHLAFAPVSGPLLAPLLSPTPSGVPAGPAGVDLNLADALMLDSLPGIGPARARAIVGYREAHGPFRAVQELARVPGIGPAALQRLQGLVRVGQP